MGPAWAGDTAASGLRAWPCGEQRPVRRRLLVTAAKRWGRSLAWLQHRQAEKLSDVVTYPAHRLFCMISFLRYSLPLIYCFYLLFVVGSRAGKS